MCVIMWCENERPTARMVDKAWDTNKDGGGVAWREGKGDKARVHWKKGLKLADMHKLMAELPFPFVGHFRKKSVGEIISSLCHPFPVTAESDLALEGSTDGEVFFHNGTWNKWDDFILEAAIKGGQQIPAGKWSDTRAMAWLTSWMGPGFLEIIGAKGILFGPDDYELFEGPTGWKKINGVWCSNDIFWPAHGVQQYQGPTHQSQGGSTQTSVTGSTSRGADTTADADRIYCKETKCTRKDKKNFDAWGFCPDHSTLPKKTEQAGEGPTVGPNVTTTSTSGSNATASQPTGSSDPSFFERRVKGVLVPESVNVRHVRGKNQPSPFQPVVDQAREVGRTQGPFAGKAFIDQMVKEGNLSKSQHKILDREFNRLEEKRNRTERRLASALAVLPAD